MNHGLPKRKSNWAHLRRWFPRTPTEAFQLEILIFLLQLPSSLLDFCRFRIRFLFFELGGSFCGRLRFFHPPQSFPLSPFISNRLGFQVGLCRSKRVSANSFRCSEFGLLCLMLNSETVIQTVYFLPLLCLNSLLGIFWISNALLVATFSLQ
jgi:hypothetical protein